METPPVHECPKYHGPDLPVVSPNEPDVTDALYRPHLNQQLVLRFWRRQGKPQRVVLVAYGQCVVGTRTPFGEVFFPLPRHALCGQCGNPYASRSAAAAWPDRAARDAAATPVSAARGASH